MSSRNTKEIKSLGHGNKVHVGGEIEMKILAQGMMVPFSIGK